MTDFTGLSVATKEQDTVFFGLEAEIPTQSVPQHIRDIVYCPKCGNMLEAEYVRYNHIGRHYCPDCGTEALVQKDNSQDVYSWFGDTVLEDVAKAMAERAGFQWNTSTREMMMQQIQNGGYSIYTTFDKNAQDKVDVIYTNLDEIPDTRGGQQLQSAIVIIDNRSGDIVAMAAQILEDYIH